MLKAEQLRGVIVPTVAPFHRNGKLDLDGFRRYVQSLLDRNVNGLVINGTTGECPTVAWDEVRRMTETALELRGSRPVPVIVGTGSNDTRTAVNLTRRAKALQADGVPYYNKPS